MTGIVCRRAKPPLMRFQAMRRSCAFTVSGRHTEAFTGLSIYDGFGCMGVNQDFLEEVVQIPSIQSLYVKGLTATDLGLLSQLPRLRRVIFTQGTKIPNLEWVANLTHLESLSLEGFKQVFHLDPLASLAKLSALGFEGSTFTPMRVSSLTPLGGLPRLAILVHHLLAHIRRQFEAAPFSQAFGNFAVRRSLFPRR